MSVGPEGPVGMEPVNISQHRGWFTALGVALMVLGIVAVVAAFAATLATVLFFGVVMLIAGFVQVIHAITSTRWRGFVLHLLGGILYAIIGGMIVFDPVAGAIGLTLLLAAFFVATGVVKCILGFQAESAWFAVNGLIDLLLGLLVWIGWPETGTWVIGLFLGVELLFAGLSLILLASGQGPFRRFERRSTEVHAGS